MEKPDIEKILERLPGAQIGVLGDFALDVYLEVKTETGEYSVETGKPVVYGKNSRSAPGGAGNIARNLADLRVAKVHAFGLLGDDLFGRELLRELANAGVDTSGCLVQEKDWHTPAYVKPILESEELNRLDFGAHNVPSAETMRRLLSAVEKKLPTLSVLIVNQQLRWPLLTPDFAEQLTALLKSHRECLTFGDCRQRVEGLECRVSKFNAAEACKILSWAGADPATDAGCRALTQDLRGRLGCDVVITRGEHGVMAAGSTVVSAVPGIFTMGDTDPVGAGDTFTAACAAALAGGTGLEEAVAFANLAASVTVRKKGQTGTAVAEEIILAAQTADYNYHPDLAADPRLARFAPGTEIEWVRPPPDNFSLRRVVFDHDGTLSTLRQGWEEVMFEVACECIAGPGAAGIGRGRKQKIEEKVRRMISATTGIQTIQQMMRLREMVAAEGLHGDLRPPEEYKSLFLNRLMAFVRDRMHKLAQGILDPADFTLKGASAFARELSRRGIPLYLASGTDQEDVIREARALGYADVFSGGIFGSLGNELGDAKQKVIRKILDGSVAGEPGLLVVGDGPVEMREGKKAGAFCIGVASDELRRFGLNAAKRRRLILAGADMIVPDFSQGEKLLELLRA